MIRQTIAPTGNMEKWLDNYHGPDDLILWVGAFMDAFNLSDLDASRFIHLWRKRAPIDTVELADALTVEDVRAMIDAPAARAIDEDAQYNPRNNGTAPHAFDPLPLGTWRIGRLGDADVLINIPIADVQPSEGDWEWAIRHWTTRNYIKWLEEGFTPPPITVVRNDRGRLISMNRRRWLAARAVGLEHLPGWYSPSHARHASRSRWYLPEWNEAARQSFALWTARGVDPHINLTAEEVRAIRMYARPRLPAPGPSS